MVPLRALHFGIFTFLHFDIFTFLLPENKIIKFAKKYYILFSELRHRSLRAVFPREGADHHRDRTRIGEWKEALRRLNAIKSDKYLKGPTYIQKVRQMSKMFDKIEKL